MPATNRDLMTQARASLKGHWGLAIGGNVIYLVLFALIQSVPHFGWLSGLIIGGPLIFGFSTFFLSLSRRRVARLPQLFDGFKHFVNTLKAYLFMTLFILLWTLLFIIPGLVACLSYSQTFFILADNPQIEGREALKKSKSLMTGNRWRLFFLFWRFFGWFLLGILSLGIGFLWIIPYLSTTLALFYDDVTTDNNPSFRADLVLEPLTHRS
jgi:uncharacterized membrane protein